MKKTLFNLTLVFCLSTFVTKGQQTLRDTIPPFYLHNFSNFNSDDIKREHIPFDFMKVKMIPFRDGDSFGFLDKKKGQIIIKPIYKQVLAVYSEGAVVSNGDDYFLINENGKNISGRSYAKLYKENDIFVGIDLKTYITHTGKNGLSDNFAEFTYFKPGKILFKETNVHDYIGFNDNDTLAWFRSGTRYTIRGKSGKIWKQFYYNDNKKFVGIFNNLMVFAEVKDDKQTFVGYNAFGKLVFRFHDDNTEYEEVYMLNKNLFARKGVLREF